MAHLPVLKSDHRTSADLVRLYDQAMVSYLEAITPPRDMEWGLAYGDSTVAGSWHSQCILQGNLPAGMDATTVVRLMQDHFAQQSATLHAIALNPSAEAQSIQSLEQVLISLKMIAHPWQVMQLSHWTVQALPQAEWQIIPARAGYRHLESLVKRLADSSPTAISPETMIAHLDDPRLDAILLMHHGDPVGYGDMLSMGQTGVIMQLLATSSARQLGLDRVILHELIQLAGRSQFRHILMGVEPEASSNLALLTACGFSPAGPWTLWMNS